MKPGLTRRSRQRGMAVVVLIALLLLGGALFTLNSFSFSTVRVERDRVTNEALARAKDALIAYAVADNVRPGELPCPDVNDDGKLVLGEDLIGSACASLVGRLPWSTLGLPDLRDDAGERLWYALSNDFHANGSVALNSDTAYVSANSLTLHGMEAVPVPSLVAIVFSPGAALRRTDGVAQARGCIVGTDCDATLKCTTVPASSTAKCNPANYLDIASGQDNADADRQFVSAPRSASFNDRAMPVFSDDVMRLVERRAARELAQRLRNHYDAWQTPPPAAGVTYVGFKGFYPWAAPLNDPSVVAAGVNGTTNGQLPLDASSVVWDPPSATLGACAGANTAQISCTAFSVLGLLSVNGRLRNVGTAFVDPPTVSAVGLIVGTPAVTWTFDPAGQAVDFTWSATLLGLATVTASANASAWTSASWLASNNWHQNALYTVSPGYAINGIDSCGGAGPACLTIANTAAPNDDKHAVVMMTGRALAAAAQPARPVGPPASLGQFLEGLNADGTLTQFEANARTATFNDTAAAVRP